MFLKNCLVLVIILTTSGCTTGILYTDITEPYCTNMNNTPLLAQANSAPLKQISIPQMPGARIRWNTNTINDIAKEAGISKIAFCDRKIYRILLGLWEEDSIIVYGE